MIKSEVVRQNHLFEQNTRLDFITNNKFKEYELQALIVEFLKIWLYLIKKQKKRTVDT